MRWTCFFAILAVTVLGCPQAWAGYLNAAYGVGAILAAPVSVLLVGLRLGVPILGRRVVAERRAGGGCGRSGPGGNRGAADAGRREPRPSGRR